MQTTGGREKSRAALDRQSILRRLNTIEKSLDTMIVSDMAQSLNLDVELRLALQHVQAALDQVPRLNGWENR